MTIAGNGSGRRDPGPGAVPVMYRKVLVGYDLSEQAKDALALGKVLASTSGAQLILAGVVRADPLLGGMDPLSREADSEFVQAITEAAEGAGAEAQTISSSSPARGLHELAEDIEADLVVVGSSRHGGVGRAVAGSVGQRLFQGASCGVAIAPRDFREREPGLRVIAVGYDGLEESREALTAAIALSQAAGATLRIIVVAEPLPAGRTSVYYPASDYARALHDQLEKRLQEALDSTPAELRPLGQLLKGDVATTLLSEAEKKGIDLLCVGSRAYGPVRRVLLGSVSSELVKSAPCALLVVPRAAASSPIPSAELGVGESAR